MTTLKISDRDEVLRRTLTDAFSPRFSALASQLQDELRKMLADKHPLFLSLMKDPETKPYVSFRGVNDIYLIDGEETLRTAEPRFGAAVGMPSPRSYFDRDEYTSLKAQDTVIPVCFGEVKIASKKHVTAYRKAWADYVAARQKISALLYSYTQREKFAADFPEFAKYLPAIEVKASLPMVIVKDVRKELTALGVTP